MENITQKQAHERGIDVMYKIVYKALLQKDKIFSKLSQEEQNAKMNFIKIAYHMAKAFHRPQKRLDGTRYFEHIKSVAHILVSEFPHVTVDQVLAAYLHDIVEDTDITYATINNIFGPNVTRIVDAVTKKPDDFYLWPDENQYYKSLDKDGKKKYLESKKKIIKARRQEHYFGHMRDMDNEILQVKFADRIHNLRDLIHCKISKIKDQIDETQQYLLPVAKEKNPIAYNLMKKELEKLHKHVYGNTDKFKKYLQDILG